MTSFLLQQPSWCPMCPQMGAWGWFGMIAMILLWILIIGLLVWLVYRLATGWRNESSGVGPDDRALETLRERYARGEIDEDTYERMKRKLEQR